MSDFQVIPAQLSDVDWIFNLAIKNNRSNVADRSQGFIQGSAEKPDAYKNWAETGSLFIIKNLENQDNVGFFALQKTNIRQSHSPKIVQYLYDNLENLTFEGRSLDTLPWTMYGPVLIATEYRGKGLSHLIINFAQKEAAKNGFEIITAFVDFENKKSLAVHLALGMQVIKEVRLAEGNYYLLAKSTH